MGKDGLKPEVTTVISQTIAEAGLSRAQVVLPHDLGADNAVLSHQCPAQQFQAGNCPPDSIIGSAVAASPLQTQALTGPVALVAPPTPALPQVGLDLRGPLALKLTGNFVLTPQGTGVAFEGLPDIPISRFQLTFFGGANGIVLAARQVCKPPPLDFSTDFLAHSGATTTGSTAAQIDGTCGQDAGGHGRKAAGKLKLGRLGSDRPRMKLEVKAGSEKLRRVTAKLPPELHFGSQRKFKQGSSLEGRWQGAERQGGEAHASLAAAERQASRRFVLRQARPRRAPRRPPARRQRPPASEAAGPRRERQDHQADGQSQVARPPGPPIGPATVRA